MESSRFEKAIVEAQLGRELKNQFRVVKRCSWGYPQCIQSDLISNGKPFPTLFWLTCPFLYKEVSDIDSKLDTLTLQDISEVTKEKIIVNDHLISL